MRARDHRTARAWTLRLPALFLTAALAGCGDSSPSDTGPTPTSVAAAAGDAQTATVGQLLGTALAVVVTGSDGQPYQGAAVSWQVASGGGSISPASSQTDTQGQATAQWTLGTGAGAQTATATVQGLQPVTFSATGTPGSAAQVVVTPGSATIDALQGTLQLDAELQDAFGNAIPGATFTWSSNDESVATVDASGLAMGVAVGTAQVSAEADGEGVGGSAAVEVRQVPASVAITPADPQVTLGGTLQLAAEVKDANGNDLPSPDVTWTSADESIATVDADGLLEGVAEGQVDVTAASGTASGSTTAAVILEADDFEPSTDMDIGGQMTVGKLTVPAGVTLTVTSDLTLTALEDIDVQGTITGDCVQITVQGRAAATYAGTVSNACSAESEDDLPDVVLVNDGALTVDGAAFTYAGDVEIKNNPTVTPDDFVDLEGVAARSGSRGTAGPAGPALAPGGGPCIVIGGTFAPASPAGRTGSDGTSAGAGGGNAGDVRLTCDGDLQISGGSTVEGRSGGDGGDGMNADPSSDDASTRGGDGGDGGDVDVRATGDITFDDAGGGTTITLTNGGNGGDATILGKDPGGSATATGGDGGDGGNTHVSAGGSITIDPGGLTLVVGKGGDGGEAIANAGNGKDADAAAATPGGGATATGGAAGHSVLGTLRARGAVNGRGNIVVTGGDGGRGGDATAVGGKGGDGNLTFPDGAGGGAMAAHGGKGGDARTKDITGTTVGTSGDGGDIRVVNGRGGDGADRCSIPDSGGSGGDGGSAAGAPGDGGGGDNPGMKGKITVAENTGNAGDGMNGNGPGSGGSAGADDLATGFDRTDEGLFTFQNGVDGADCPAGTKREARIRLSAVENTSGNVPFGTQTLPLDDVETDEQLGTVPLTTVGSSGNHYWGSSPDRIGVSGGNGFAVELAELQLTGVDPFQVQDARGLRHQHLRRDAVQPDHARAARRRWGDAGEHGDRRSVRRRRMHQLRHRGRHGGPRLDGAVRGRGGLPRPRVRSVRRVPLTAGR